MNAPEQPTVSVLLTAYNRERFIGQAIASVLGQTWEDFELVVVDDGSSDDTVRIIASFDDPRIKIVQHARNRGTPATRNSALEHASGQYLAWLDSDDVARPERLERQLAYLKANPDVAMVGSCAGKLNEHGRRKAGVRIPPLRAEQIRCWLLFRSAFQQSSIFGRADILKRYPYSPEFPVCQDVDMFIRISSEHRVENLPEVLIDRRIHAGQTVRTRADRILQAKATLSAPILARLGMSFDETDLRRHALLGGSYGTTDDEFLGWADQWLRRIVEANRETAVFDHPSLRLCAGFFWIKAWTQRKRTDLRWARALAFWGASGALSGKALDWARQTAPLMLRRS